MSFGSPKHWDQLRACFERYMDSREKFISVWRERGEQLGYSYLEIYWCEAGKVLFEMLGIPGLPSEEEMGKQGRMGVKPAPTPRNGFVYLMRNARNGYIKIGFSKNPEFRERTFHAEEPQVTLIAKVQGTTNLESTLHLRFQRQRLRGEWFNLRRQQVEEIIQEFQMEKVA